MKSFRPERVGHLIREVVSEAITNRLNDPRIEPLSSVTRVEVTADLEHAKVWVSVMGTEAVQRRTISGLQSATGFIQGLVARELHIRTCPRLTFKLDESIKKGEAVLRLIEQTMAEYRPAEAQTAEAVAGETERPEGIEGEQEPGHEGQDMKRGTEYAKRIKQLYHQMLKKFGKPELPEPTDPIQQLIIGILAENSSESKAAGLFKRIGEQMVDLNELRVTPAQELAELIGSTVPQGREKADRIVRVLNEVRVRQDALDLSFLKQRGRREAREYLESLDGVGPCAAASVVVHSLGGHAIPVDFLTIYVLRKEEAIDDTANAADVQGFLERNVAAADCPSFVTLLNRYVAAEGARVQVNKLPELLNLKPPVLLKPIHRPGMEKGRMALPKEVEPGLPEIEGVDLEEVLVVGGDLEAGENGDERERKPAASKKDKKTAPAATPAKVGRARPASASTDHGTAGHAGTKEAKPAKPKPKAPELAKKKK